MDKPHVFAKSKKAVIIGVFFDFFNKASIFREMGREGLVLVPRYSTNPLFHSEGPEMAKLMVDIKTKNTLQKYSIKNFEFFSKYHAYIFMLLCFQKFFGGLRPPQTPIL